jgi:hypothetical protein
MRGVSCACITRVRINKYGTCECDTDGVSHVTRVKVNGDAVDGHGDSGVVIAGHAHCAGMCVKCHVTF